jgi:hypothetical protein
MSQIQNHFIEIVNKQLFRDAAEKVVFLLAFYQNIKGKNDSASHLIPVTEQLIYKISNTQVINPTQYDNLYADVLNSIKSVIAEIEKLTNIDSVWEQFQSTNSKIKRYILDENLAVCDNIFTKDGHNIAFYFAFEDRYFEYDEKVFVQNPACFYMEDREVLAVTDRAQGLLTLEDYIAIADKHPTDAIKVFDNQTKIDILSGKQNNLLKGKTGDWFW